MQELDNKEIFVQDYDKDNQVNNIAVLVVGEEVVLEVVVLVEEEEIHQEPELVEDVNVEQEKKDNLNINYKYIYIYD